MFIWLRDFFINKQTFVSTMSDLIAAAAVAAAVPGVAEAIGNPWVTLAGTVLAYVGGVASGRKTG